MVEVVLNRASLVPLYPAEDEAGNHTEALLRGLACLEDVTLLSHDDLWVIPLVEGEGGGNALTFGEVVHSFYGTMRHEVAVFFDALQRMAPADAGLKDEQIEQLLNFQAADPAPGLEFTFPAVQAAGMEAFQCALTDGVLASLCRDARWECDRMGFVDPLVSRPFTFDHVGTAVHGQAVATRRRTGVRPRLTKRNFWDLKDEYFPHLRFGMDVEAHVVDFSASYLGLAFKRLQELNEYSDKIAAGRSGLSTAEKQREGIKPESEQTMSNFSTERNFRDTEGEIRTFEEHVWVDTLHRIHIFIHPEAPMIEIGYMGRHLTTWNHRT